MKPNEHFEIYIRDQVLDFFTSTCDLYLTLKQPNKGMKHGTNLNHPFDGQLKHRKSGTLEFLKIQFINSKAVLTDLDSKNAYQELAKTL